MRITNFTKADYSTPKIIRENLNPQLLQEVGDLKAANFHHSIMISIAIGTDAQTKILRHYERSRSVSDRRSEVIAKAYFFVMSA